jgi:hypothetical protein
MQLFGRASLGASLRDWALLAALTLRSPSRLRRLGHKVTIPRASIGTELTALNQAPIGEIGAS